MADLSPEQAIEKLRALPEGQQRLVLGQLSADQRKGILTQLQGPQKPTPTSQADIGKVFQREQEKGRDFYKGLGAVGKFTSSFESQFGIPESVQQHPSEAIQGLKMSVMHPGLEVESLREMWNGLSDAQKKLQQEALATFMGPGVANKAEGFMLGIYSAIPVFGPAIVNAVRQYQSGDKAGAAGSFAGIFTQLYRPGEAKVAVEPAGPRAPGAMGAVPRAPEGGIRALAQSITGVGPESTTEPLIDKYKSESAAAEAANRRMTEKKFREAGEKRADYEAKQKDQAETHRQNTQKVMQFNAEQDAARQRKTTLTKQNDTESATLGQDLNQLENQVYREANRRFEDVKAQVGNATEPSTDLISDVKSIEKNILQGIPENIKEFRAILDLEGASEDAGKLRQDVMAGQGMTGSYDDLPPNRKAIVDDIVNRVGVKIDPDTPVNWNKLQSLKSRIDARLRSRVRMNGDLKRALMSARDSVVDKMGKLADQASKAQAAPAPSPAPAAVSPSNTLVNTAIQLGQGSIGTRILLADLRPRLEAQGFTPADIEAAIKQGQAEGTLSAIQIEAQFDVRPEDQAAAINIAGTPRHAVIVKARPTAPAAAHVAAVPPAPTAGVNVRAMWQDAKDFYRQWREDFHEPTGPSGSGSPVAQAFNAVDPENIRKPFISKQTTIGNRGVDTLRKYSQFGGNQVADRAAGVVARDQELSGIKPKENKPLPQRPKPVPKPADVEAEFEEVKPLTAQDLRSLKMRKLRETTVSWSKFHTYDLGILASSAVGGLLLGKWEGLIVDPAFVAARKSFGRLISRDAARAWLAQPLPEEIAALERLPEEMKDDVRGTLRTFVKQEKIATVAKPIKDFLVGKPPSPRAATAVGRRKPGEQLSDIEAIQQKYGSNPAMPYGAR